MTTARLRTSRSGKFRPSNTQGHAADVSARSDNIETRSEREHASRFASGPNDGNITVANLWLPRARAGPCRARQAHELLTANAGASSLATTLRHSDHGRASEPPKGCMRGFVRFPRRRVVSHGRRVTHSRSTQKMGVSGVRGHNKDARSGFLVLRLLPTITRAFAGPARPPEWSTRRGDDSSRAGARACKGGARDTGTRNRTARGRRSASRWTARERAGCANGSLA